MGSLTRIEEVFSEVLQRSAKSRDVFLRNRCEDNQSLQASVQSLLRAHARKGSCILDNSTVFNLPSDLARHLNSTEADHCTADEPGTIIGSYLLLDYLGDGGMGTVYLARELAPIQRTVALKLLKTGMDCDQAAARFVEERQSLALLQHPYIPRIFNAGITQDGRGFLAMEHIDGATITDVCVRQQLSMENRIVLFRRVCEAVSHAHQNGIIHRDIKPSNVLVVDEDGLPCPRLIDFGIAAFLDSDFRQRGVPPLPDRILGTLDYMSPEQTRPGVAQTDERSDIYSLGVLLYELLTTTTPLSDFGADQIPEKINALRHRDPIRPSKIIAPQATPCPDHIALLDRITMKCLSRCPNRRYQTVGHLIEDLSTSVQHTGATVSVKQPSPVKSRSGVRTMLGRRVFGDGIDGCLRQSDSHLSISADGEGSAIARAGRGSYCEC